MDYELLAEHFPVEPSRAAGSEEWEVVWVDV